MTIKIVKGEMEHVDDCIETLLESDLGREYFDSSYTRVQKQINEGISKEEVHVALDCEGRCLGFVWCIPQGAFHAYPYLHIIAVKEAYRGKGIGRQLLNYFENELYADSSKMFLVVSEFNSRAQSLYERHGYTEVAKMHGLYRDHITENLLMKCRPIND